MSLIEELRKNPLIRAYSDMLYVNKQQSQCVNLFIQEYVHKFNITMEIDMFRLKEVEKPHKLFNWYKDMCKKFEDEGIFIKKESLVYDGKHILQISIKKDGYYLSALFCRLIRELGELRKHVSFTA